MSGEIYGTSSDGQNQARGERGRSSEKSDLSPYDRSTSSERLRLNTRNLRSQTSASEAHDRRMQETADSLGIDVPDQTTEEWKKFSRNFLQEEAEELPNPYAEEYLKAHLKSPEQGELYLEEHADQRDNLKPAAMLLDILEDRGENRLLTQMPGSRDDKVYREWMKLVCETWKEDIEKRSTEVRKLPISASKAHERRMQETADSLGIDVPDQTTGEWSEFSSLLLKEWASRAVEPCIRDYLKAHLESPDQGKRYLDQHADQINDLVPAVMLIDILEDRGENHLLTQMPGRRDDEVYRSLMNDIFKEWKEEIDRSYTKFWRLPISASDAHNRRLQETTKETGISVPDPTSGEWKVFSRFLLEDLANANSNTYIGDYLRAHLKSPDQGKHYLEEHADQIDDLVPAAILIDILEDRGEYPLPEPKIKDRDHYRSLMNDIFEQWKENIDERYIKFWRSQTSASDAHNSRMQETAENLGISAPDQTTIEWRLFSRYFLDKEAKQAVNPCVRDYLIAHLESPGQGKRYLREYADQKTNLIRAVALIDILEDRGEHPVLMKIPEIRDEKYYRSCMKSILEQWKQRTEKRYRKFWRSQTSDSEAHNSRMQETANKMGISSPNQTTEKWRLFSRYFLKKEVERAPNRYAGDYLIAHLESPDQGKRYLNEHADQEKDLVPAAILIDILEDRGKNRLLTQMPEIRDEKDYRLWMEFTLDQWEKMNSALKRWRESMPENYMLEEMPVLNKRIRMDATEEGLNLIDAIYQLNNPEHPKYMKVSDRVKDVKNAIEIIEITETEEWKQIREEVRKQMREEEGQRNIGKEEE